MDDVWAVEGRRGAADGEQVVVDDTLSNGRCMGPTKGQGQERVSVASSANADASQIGFGKTDGPETVGEVECGNARGTGRSTL